VPPRAEQGGGVVVQHRRQLGVAEAEALGGLQVRDRVPDGVVAPVDHPVDAELAQHPDELLREGPACQQVRGRRDVHPDLPPPPRVRRQQVIDKQLRERRPVRVREDQPGLGHRLHQPDELARLVGVPRRVGVEQDR
jgi:hypothetical protein